MSQSHYGNRSLPKADISNFVPPEIIKRKKCSAEDFSLIISIKNELVDNGVISSEIFMSDVDNQTIDDLVSMFSEANAGAVSERDYNPEFYSQFATDELEEQERVLEYDFENPALDGVDDYGNNMYDEYSNVRERTAEDYFPRSVRDSVIFEKPSLDDGHVRLPDGTEITGGEFSDWIFPPN